MIGSSIERNGERLLCTKVRESGINTFQVIDEQGRAIITYQPGREEAISNILDFGLRLININSL